MNNGGTVFNGQKRCDRRTDRGRPLRRFQFQNGPVINDATIIATATAAATTASTSRAAGNVSNLGTSSLIEGYAGVLIGTDGTVTNAGTIESSRAPPVSRYISPAAMPG